MYPIAPLPTLVMLAQLLFLAVSGNIHFLSLNIEEREIRARYQLIFLRLAVLVFAAIITLHLNSAEMVASLGNPFMAGGALVLASILISFLAWLAYALDIEQEAPAA